MSARLVRLWWEGARVRTLPAAVAPVLIGASSALFLEGFSGVRTFLALLVAVFLQVGVNYSNDYSDGIRGTDKDRVGPPRLTASGLVEPRFVLWAAVFFFTAAAACGVVLVALSGKWWLIVAGACAIVCAWFYTGGRHPYGYMGVGLSELFVFIFFGLMAAVGTAYVQVFELQWWVWVLASGSGLLSVALLVVNNTRDIETDVVAGKRTLAVRLGDEHSRRVFRRCVQLALVCFAIVTVHLKLSPFFFVLVMVLGVVLNRVMGQARSSGDFLAVLRFTGLFLLVYAVAVSISLFLGPSLFFWWGE